MMREDDVMMTKMMLEATHRDVMRIVYKCTHEGRGKGKGSGGDWEDGRVERRRIQTERRMVRLKA